MSDQSAVPNIPQGLVRVKEAWEWGTWAITAVGTIAAVIQGAGGIFGFLTQVALFGFSCYIAAIPVSGLAVLLFSSLDKTTGRETNDSVLLWVLIAGTLGGGFFVRSLFYDGIGRPGDMDVIGTVSMSLFGLAFLLAPLYFVWRRYGSSPKA